MHGLSVPGYVGLLVCTYPYFCLCFEAMEDAGALMRTRSDEVRQLGQNTGLLEWLAWGVLNQRRVMMLFGETVVDLFEWFAPMHAPSPTNPPCFVAAVGMTATQDQWSSAVPHRPGLGEAHALPRVSHYVIGVPSHAARSGAVAPECLGSPPQCARLAALRAGWGLKATVAQGDCAIDVMAYYQSFERHENTWKHLRGQIADFLLAASLDASWHEIFAACGEMPGLPEAVPVGPDGGPSAALRDEKGDLGLDMNDYDLGEGTDEEASDENEDLGVDPADLPDLEPRDSSDEEDRGRDECDHACFASDGEESVCFEMGVDLGVETSLERSGLESPVEPPQPPPCAPSPASSPAAGPGATDVIGQPGAPSVSDESLSLVVHGASGSVTAAGQDSALVLADDFRAVAPTMVEGVPASLSGFAPCRSKTSRSTRCLSPHGKRQSCSGFDQHEGRTLPSATSACG